MLSSHYKPCHWLLTINGTRILLSKCYLKESKLKQNLQVKLTKTCYFFWYLNITNLPGTNIFPDFCWWKKSWSSSSSNEILHTHTQQQKKIRGDDKYCVALSVRAASRRIFFLSYTVLKYFLKKNSHLEYAILFSRDIH